MKTGANLIKKERDEQCMKHGYTIEDDVEMNKNYQLADAARRIILEPIDTRDNYIPPYEWHIEGWQHILSKPYKDRLIIAGAFIAAEIDRLNYLEDNP